MSQGSEWEHRTPGEIVPEAVYSDLLTVASDVVITVDEAGTVQAVADHDAPTLGYQPGHLAGVSIVSLLAPDAPPSPLFDVRSVEGFNAAVRDSETTTVTVPCEAADGSVVPLSLTQFGAGVPGQIYLGRDVSDQVSRVRNHQTERNLLDSVPDPVYVLDSDCRFEWVNDALVACTGYGQTELHGRGIEEVLPASGSEHVTTKLRRIIESEQHNSARFETTLLTRDGEQILTETHVTALTDQQGRDTGTVGVVRNIHDRKHRERNLTLLKQVLTRVFRHNVRNKLNVTQRHAEILAGRIDDDLQTHTDKILSATSQILEHGEKSQLIGQVIESDEPSELDLTDSVSQVVEAVRGRYPKATIDVDSPESAVVTAHPAVDSAVKELVGNAIEHAPEETVPTVDIWLDRRNGTQTLFVEDESGGLSDHEIGVLERGVESDLEHSSGVGLWLVRWVVEYSDAEMIVHRTDEGSVIGIRFGQQTSNGQATREPGDAPFGRVPAHVRDVSPERFRGDTVIGRIDALGQLEEIYDALEYAGGHSVLLTGEAGIGKTTLLEQFRDRLDSQVPEPVVATGFCGAEIQPSYHAFREVMGDVPSERDVSEILAGAASIAADDAEQVEQRKHELFANIAAELRAVATDRPVVLLVEDMQWAGQGTIDLFEYLVEEVGRWGHPVMFLGTYRTSDIGRTHPVLEIAEATADAGRGTVIQLEPFDRSHVQSLLTYMLDIETVPASFVEAVHDHTGGTPLFVNELGRHLVETLGPVQSGEVLPETLDGLSVPESIESAIAQRLETLPAEVVPVVRLGAVIATEFSFDLLREASERPVDTLIECSNTLVRRQIWRQSADTVEFVHGVVREQTLETIPDEECQQLHARVAAAIETVYGGELDEYAGRLGYHYEQVGDYEAAFSYYRQAGAHASNAYANQDAIEHYDRALSLADEHGAADETALAAVSRDLGTVLELLGEYDRAHERFERSLAIFQEHGDRQGAAASLDHLAAVRLDRGEYEQAREYAERSLAICQENGNRQGEATSFDHLATVGFRCGEYKQAREHAEQSLAICREIGDARGEAESLHNLGVITWRRGEYEQAREYYEHSLDIRQAIERRVGEAATLNNLGALANDCGNYDRAQEYFEQSLDIKQDIGDRNGEAATLNNLGLVAFNRGEYDQSRTYAERSLEISREIGDRHDEAHSHHLLGKTASRRGKYDRAREYVERGLDIARDIGYRHGEANSLYTLGYIACRCGEYEQARGYHERSLTTFQDIGERQGEALSLTGQGVVAEACGELGPAQECLTAALEIARERNVALPELRVLRALGAVARRKGAYDQAEAYLDEGLDACTECDNRHERAQTRLERARLALVRGDTETAGQRVKQAQRTCADLGAVHDEARATFLRGLVALTTDSLDEACEHWLDALDTFESVGAPQDALETLETLVETRRKHGDDEQAETRWENARTILEDVPEPVQAMREEWLDTG